MRPTVPSREQNFSPAQRELVRQEIAELGHTFLHSKTDMILELLVRS